MKLKTKRIIIAIILMLIAPMALISTVHKYTTPSGVANWPHSTGIVLFSGVEEQKAYIKNKNSIINGKGYERYYTHRINYSYRINGTDFESGNFTLNDKNVSSRALLDGTGMRYYDKEAARKQAIKYRIGTAVDVYYNPDKPHIATLNQSNASLMPIFSALGFLAFAVLAMLIALEKIKPKNLPWRIAQ
jgi:hypothetical protein